MQRVEERQLIKRETAPEIIERVELHPEFTVLTEHERRLENLYGRELKQRTMFDRNAAQLRCFEYLGFSHIVGVGIASEFRYAASIFGDCVLGGFRGNRILQYVGDTPNEVVARIKSIRRTPIPKGAPTDSFEDMGHCFFSIHSNEYLPIVAEKSLLSVDPVVIWWLYNPRFRRNVWGRKWISDYDKKQRNLVGAVIGVWPASFVI